jgi:hypothetical protein
MSMERSENLAGSQLENVIRLIDMPEEVAKLSDEELKEKLKAFVKKSELQQAIEELGIPI